MGIEIIHHEFCSIWCHMLLHVLHPFFAILRDLLEQFFFPLISKAFGISEKIIRGILQLALVHEAFESVKMLSISQMVG